MKFTPAAVRGFEPRACESLIRCLEKAHQRHELGSLILRQRAIAISANRYVNTVVDEITRKAAATLTAFLDETIRSPFKPLDLKFSRGENGADFW